MASHDVTVTGNNGTGATTVASAAITTAAKRLLVAKIAITNATGQTVSSISGGGLTWTNVPGASASNGTTDRIETWIAYASAALTSQTVTATLSASAPAAIVVSAYSATQADSDGLAASGIGATNTATGTSGAPALNLTTNFGSSLVVGGLAALLNTTATAGSGQTINGQDAGTVNPRAVQSRQNASSAVGAIVTSSWTITSATWAASAIEIKGFLSPVFCCGFECGVSNAAHFTLGTNTSFVTSPVNGGGLRALRCNATTANTNAVAFLAASATRFVGRVYVYFTTLPSADCSLVTTSSTLASGPSVRFKQSDSKLYAAVGTVLGATGVVVTTGVWYRVDFDFNIQTAAVDFCDIQVDGTACGQATATGVSASTANFYVGGLTGTPTHDIYFDDLVLSNTAADYPVGAGKVLSLVPAADGTHTFTTTHAILGTTGAPTTGGNITSATTTAFGYVNARPVGGGVADATRLWNQATAAAAEYAEVTIEQTTETSAPRAVEVLCIAREASSTGCNSHFKVNDNGTEAVVYDMISPAGNSDEFKSLQFALMPADSAGWTLARFKALKLRWGYSSDATPDVYCRGWMVEAEFAIAGSVTVTPPIVALVLTAFAPKLVETTIPSIATLALTTFAPSVTLGAIPAVASLSISTFAPTIVTTANVTVTPAIASLTASSFVPVLALTVTPSLGTFSTATFAPILATTIALSSTSLTLTTFAPTLTLTITPATKSLTTTSFAPTLSETTIPVTASLTINSFASTVTLNAIIVPDTTALTMSAFVPVISLSIVSATASLALQTFSVTLAEILTPEATPLTLTTFAPSVNASANVTVVPDTASLSVSTFAVTLNETVTSSKASLAVNSFAPRLAESLTPGTLPLLLSTFVATVSVGSSVDVEPATANLALISFAPVLALAVSPSVATLTIGILAPSLAVTVTPARLTLGPTSFTPALALTIQCATTPLTLTTSTSTLNESLSPQTVNLSLVTFAVELQGTTLTVTPSTLPLSLITLAPRVHHLDAAIITTVSRETSSVTVAASGSMASVVSKQLTGAEVSRQIRSATVDADGPHLVTA